MRHYGLIGKGLGHSFSKAHFEQCCQQKGKTDRDYQLVDLSTVSDIRTIVDRLQLDGFNVTSPFKTDIIDHLDELTPRAAEIGAVNVVHVVRTRDDLMMYGDNTDAPAFCNTLLNLIEPRHREALILGTGGAAQAVAWAFRKIGLPYLMASRHKHSEQIISYSEAAEQFRASTILINATPVGMGHLRALSPWPYPHLIGQSNLCYDLIYNPSPTLFLKQAASRGAQTTDGLAMLYRQAELSGFVDE